MRTLIVILFLPFIVNSQIPENKLYLYSKLSTGKVDTAFYSNFSIAGEYLVRPYLGLNYNFDFMHRNDNIFQLHSTVGPIAAPIMFIAQFSNYTNIATGSTAGKLGIVLLALLIPDGVSFHIPYQYKYDFSPYFNILGFDYIKDKNLNYKYFRYSASFGFKTSYCYSNNLTLIGFTETRKVSGMGWSLGLGVGIGYTFTPDGIDNIHLIH